MSRPGMCAAVGCTTMVRANTHCSEHLDDAVDQGRIALSAIDDDLVREEWKHLRDCGMSDAEIATRLRVPGRHVRAWRKASAA
ncbi:hypothetical protein SEA_VANLEE_89 [Gordonia phage VanLee]|uniref:Helix-turn-helix DNA binding domain protein n=1 Tax=Gordonia phage VanLee TaxID=2845816 RepID=A0A8F2IF83_9CAUD|nr:hypothetical protein QEH49_gp089 [Gordonia phage VanLee]QWS68206.1 hypothetical protein SEA_VANLEE_89 [Gordonia phage VanLee]